MGGGNYKLKGIFFGNIEKCYNFALSFMLKSKFRLVRDFHKLNIWHRSHLVTLDIYKVSRTFPKEELFRLTSQIRRASSSIPTNIAEGCGRSSNKDFSHFMQIAIGSACEVEYELILAHDLGYINDEDYNRLSSEIITIRRMINSLQSELMAQS